MNSDEVRSLMVKLLLVAITPFATKFHIDGNVAAGVASDLADLAVLGYGVYDHWNMRKVPESAAPVRS